MTFLHGVETSEFVKGPVQIQTVPSAIIGLVGTAPMNQVASANQTVDKVQLVSSDLDAANYFGPDTSGFSIPTALKQIFAQGNGTVLVVNVLDPSTDTTAVTSESHVLTSSDIATLAHPAVQSVVVKDSTGDTTYVANTDYTVDTAAGTVTRLSTGAITALGTIKVSYSYLDPTKADAAAIIGTVDGSGHRTGLQAFLDARGTYGFGPKQIIAPTFCGLTGVMAAMTTLAGKLRAIAWIDAASGQTVSQAITARGGAGALNTSSKRIGILYPYVKTTDASGNVVTVPQSAFVAGAQAAKDATKGFWWSVSNTELVGVVGLERPVYADFRDATSEANLLNAAGILTIYNDFGTGFRVWGDRGAGFPTSTEPDSFLCVRRTADMIEDSIEAASLKYMDRPITPALRDQIVGDVDAYIRWLQGRGAVLEGSKAFYDPTRNPAQELAAGHLTISYRFLPPSPLERLTYEGWLDITLYGGQ